MDGIELPKAPASDPRDLVVLLTSDGAKLYADRQLLCAASPVFAAAVAEKEEEAEEEEAATGTATCPITLSVSESSEALGSALEALRGRPPPGTYLPHGDMGELLRACEGVLRVAAVYGMPLLTERVEGWMLARRIRFPKQPLGHLLAYKWLALCHRHGLEDLGWHVSERLAAELALPGASWAAKLLACREAHPEAAEGFDEYVLKAVEQHQQPGGANPWRRGEGAAAGGDGQ